MSIRSRVRQSVLAIAAVEKKKLRFLFDKSEGIFLRLQKYWGI